MKNINDMTMGEIQEALARADEIRKVLGSGIGASFPSTQPAADSNWVIGQNYFIRTVTHHIVGKLVGIDSHEIALEDASWVADDGRFHECLRDGTVNENEPAPEGVVLVGRGSLIDAYRWNHPLLREVA
jgi:hypothetical protein